MVNHGRRSVCHWSPYRGRRRPRDPDLVVMVLCVPHPLSRDLVLSVVPGEVVVEERDCRVRIVLDPLEGCPQVWDKVWRGDLRG